METPSFASETVHREETAMKEDTRVTSADEDDITYQTYQLVKDLSATKKSYDLGCALIFIAVAFFIMLGAFLGAVSFSIYLLRGRSLEHNDVLNSDTGHPSRIQQQYEYVGLQDLNELPLSQVEAMQSVVLQWGKAGAVDGKQYYYNIQSAFRDGATNTTTLNLSLNHKLIADNDKAVLLDESSNELGVLQFNKGYIEGQHDQEGSTLTNIEQLLEGQSREPGTRRLGKLFGEKLEELVTKKQKDHRIGGPPPADMFDAYCRYGCGGMAVTFPYYYRPFFGYGYPLVGTESQFPQGYGGYAGAPIMRQAHEQYAGAARF